MASPRSTINTNTVSQKLRTLKCLYHVQSNVLCQGNPETHDNQRMPVAIYPGLLLYSTKSLLSALATELFPIKPTVVATTIPACTL